jgi:PTS system cellobiose-specific IIB component
MATILVVCGAGASSTFLASRIRALAATDGLDITAKAISESELEAHVPAADAILIGPHLADGYDALVARANGVPTALLPADAFAPAHARAALDAALALLQLDRIDTSPTTQGATHG